MQGRLQAKGVKYDRWYMHLGKVHCIRLPEFLISLLETVGLTFFPNVIITLISMPVKMGLLLSEQNSSSFFSRWVDNAVFLLQGTEKPGCGASAHAGCSPHRALVQLVTGWKGNWSFIRTLRTGDNDPKFFVVFVPAIYFLFLNCGCFQIFC